MIFRIVTILSLQRKTAKTEGKRNEDLKKG